jgi:hypothetical protein
MEFKVGDTVIAEAESTTRTPRRGTVEEVLPGARVRYRIRWDDGHETIYSPAAGALKADPSGRAA